MSVELQVHEPRGTLLDEPFALAARGATQWRARYRDDDGRVWRAAAEDPAELALAWAPAKASSGAVAALQSLRPVSIDVRAEAGSAAASRTLTRLVLGEGVRVRRWRDAGSTVYLPAGEPLATLIAETEPVAAALLASRGVLTLIGEAADRLALVPGATEPVRAEVPLPPNTGATTPEAVRAWDELLGTLGARPRRVPAEP